MKDNTIIVGKHYHSIDGMRGIAALLVLWWHSSYFVTIDMNVGEQLSGLTYNYYILTILGQTGVDMFFVISGFLITGILIDTAEDKHTLKNFYIRRALRIFPLYYAALFVFFTYFLLIYGFDSLNYMKVLTYFLYLQNWSLNFSSDQFILLDHTWSLAVEEQFYLFWPLLFLSFYKESVRNALIVCVIMIVFSWGLRLLFSDFGLYKWSQTFTISRLDGLALGAILSMLCVNYKDKCVRYSHLLPWVIMITFLAIILTIFLQETLSDIQDAIIKYCLTFFSVLYVALLAHIYLSNDKNIIKRFFSYKGLRHIGRLSYGMYIFHFPIMIFITKQLNNYDLEYWEAHIILLFSGTISSYVMAFFTYHLLEKRMLNLKDKYARLTN